MATLMCATDLQKSLADSYKNPLSRIDAGLPLGTSAASVASNLAESFHLAEKLKYVVLLDEADVILEQRNSSDVARNALVAGKATGLVHAVPASARPPGSLPS